MTRPSSTANAQDVTANDWVNWNGGECPVDDDARVEIILGDKDPATAAGLAGHYTWSHAGIKHLDAHITAYRVVQS